MMQHRGIRMVQLNVNGMKEESRIRNSVKFEINKEMYDREGRYVVVKGKIGRTNGNTDQCVFTTRQREDIL